MSQQRPPGVTVTGTGRAGAAPDVFVARLMAQATADVPADAMARTAEAAERMRAVALELGAEPTTGAIVLRQGYDHQGQPRGVVAELSFTLRSSDPAAGGDLVAACITAGGDEARLDGTHFEHAEPGRLVEAARDEAFRDAATKAHQLAGLALRRLGAVRDVMEEGRGGSPVLAKALAFDAGPPVDPGTLDAEVTVTVTWDWA